MAMFTIPLRGTKERFNIDLNDVTYEFILDYNVRADRWILAIYESDTVLIAGLPLVIGKNIISGHGLNIDNLEMVSLDLNNTDDATIGAEDLGLRVVMTHEEAA